MTPLPPLLQLTTLDGETYVFDQNKVAALYMTGRIANGDIVLHLLGLAAMPLPVGGTADDFFTSFDKTTKAQFISLTGKDGPAMVKATGVSYLLPNVPGDNEPNVHCAIYFGSNQYLKATEDVATVADRINTVRKNIAVQLDINPLLF
jgi:hypothetical protein